MTSIDRNVVLLVLLMLAALALAGFARGGA